MTDEKVQELLKDKSFFEELGKTGSAEEAQKLFASKGAVVSMEELLALFAKIKQKIGTELSDEELAAVVGGISDRVGLFVEETKLSLAKLTPPPPPIDDRTEIEIKCAKELNASKFDYIQDQIKLTTDELKKMAILGKS
jgi:bacteriocin-like protein